MALIGAPEAWKGVRRARRARRGAWEWLLWGEGVDAGTGSRARFVRAIRAVACVIVNLFQLQANVGVTDAREGIRLVELGNCIR